MSEVTICIPVRGGSKRIPRKNMLLVGNETMLARKIRQVLPLGKVVVGSDDESMLEEAQKHGAETIKRTKTNEGADSANDMIAEFMELIEPCQTVIWAHCTNPLISTETYLNALNTFYASQNEYDSLISVHEIHGHFWQDNKPLYDVDACRIKHVCANDLKPLYEQDGAIFIQPYTAMKENNYFFGEKPLLYKIPESEFLDINEPRDVMYLNAILGYK